MGEYSHNLVNENVELTKFVHGPLTECIRAAAPEVKALRYVENMTEYNEFGNDRFFSQAVIVVFENGYRKIANVALDSPWGAIKDVMKCIER